MKLTYDKSKVIWEYEGKQYEYLIEEIAGAYLEKGYIYITSNDRGYTKYTNTFITCRGELIVSSSYTLAGYSNFITILDEKNEKNDIKIEHLHSVHATVNYIYVIAGEHKKEKVIKLSLHGKTIREYPLPENYSAERFFSLIDDDKEIKVILNGEEEKGSWQWCFVLNTETGIWERRQSIDGH